MADLHLGRRIREARIQRGLSLAELALPLGISTQQQRKYEAGRNALPASRLPAMAAALGLHPDRLFEGVGADLCRPLLPTRPRMLLDLVRAGDALPEAGLVALLQAARALTPTQTPAQPPSLTSAPGVLEPPHDDPAPQGRPR